MRSNPRFPHRQRGALLVVSLLLLLVMTVLALTASQSTQMQERMAGNARDLDLAFQAVEAGVRGGEVRIDDVVAPKRTSRVTCGDFATCDAIDRREAQQDYIRQDGEGWDDEAYSLDAVLTQVSEVPKFVVSEWTDVQDTLTESGPMKTGTLYYVTTARALGATNTAVAIVETAYAVRY